MVKRKRNKNEVFLDLRQEVSLIHLKDFSIIIIRDSDTGVETSIPYASKKDYKKLIKLFQKFNDMIIKYDVSEDQWLVKETIDE
jgi:hypothetical protein